MYMRDSNDEFGDLRVPASLKLASGVALVGSLYLGILPTRILDWTIRAALK